MVTTDTPLVVDRLKRRVLRYDRPLTRADFERVPLPDRQRERSPTGNGSAPAWSPTGA